MCGVSTPQRGEVWLADLSPTVGHEPAGRRPVLIVSVDPFNLGQSGLAVVLPITSRIRPLLLHVPVHPPEEGLRQSRAILCDARRSQDQRRLVSCRGTVRAAMMALVEKMLTSLAGVVAGFACLPLLCSYRGNSAKCSHTVGGKGVNHPQVPGPRCPASRGCGYGGEGLNTNPWRVTRIVTRSQGDLDVPQARDNMASMTQHRLELFLHTRFRHASSRRAREVSAILSIGPPARAVPRPRAIIETHQNW